MQNKFDLDIKYEYDDVMIKPCYSTINSRSEVNLECTYSFGNDKTWTGIPIIAANMDTIGTFDMYRVLVKYKMLTALHKFYTVADYERESIKEQLDPNYYMVTTGISDADYEKFNNIQKYLNAENGWICIDVANGYMSNFLEFCKRVRRDYPKKIIVAGNVVTAEMTKKLFDMGWIDVVKVGIGGGVVCETRKKTGIGMPQLSAVIEYATVGAIVADGGIKHPCDVAKAFGGGAKFVMMGGAFSGHDECAGEIVEENDIKYKLFYGMSSQYAMERHYGKMDKYRTSEGSVTKVKCKGSVENTIIDYLGGLRSTCAYVGAQNLSELFDKVTFIIRK